MQQIFDYICFQLKGKDVQVLRTKPDVLLQQREPMKQPKINPKIPVFVCSCQTELSVMCQKKKKKVTVY